MVKDGQVSETILRTIGNGISGITGSCPCGTDKIPYAIGG